MSGGKARRSAGRQQLDREVIVSTAIDLAATGETITFRALGSALGSDPTAVYRHFRDKEELMQAIVDRLIASMLDQLDQDAPWRDQLREGALLSIDIFAAHPRVGIEASAIATGGPGELRAINWILTQLERSALGRRPAGRGRVPAPRPGGPAAGAGGAGRPRRLRHRHRGVPRLHRARRARGRPRAAWLSATPTRWCRAACW